jgi:hypothetical protein
VSYDVYLSPSCKKQVRKLAKKYRSLPNDLGKLSTALKSNPAQGTPLGNNVYKIRLAVASKGKGKRGGFRAITYIKILEKEVYLIALYDKSERGNITDAEIRNSLYEIS